MLRYTRGFSRTFWQRPLPIRKWISAARAALELRVTQASRPETTHSKLCRASATRSSRKRCTAVRKAIPEQNWYKSTARRQRRNASFGRAAERALAAHSVESCPSIFNAWTEWIGPRWLERTTSHRNTKGQWPCAVLAQLNRRESDYVSQWWSLQRQLAAAFCIRRERRQERQCRVLSSTFLTACAALLAMCEQGMGKQMGAVRPVTRGALGGLVGRAPSGKFSPTPEKIR